MAVISGKIVIQVSSAILYGGGGATPGWPGKREPGFETGHEAGAHRADHVWFGALEPGGVLVGVEPGAQVLAAVEPIDGAVFARRCALRAEDLDPEMAGELARRGDDPLQKLLVGTPHDQA